MFADITASPFVLIGLYGVPAQHYGFIFGANAFGFIAASRVNLRLLSRFPPGHILGAALLGAAGAGAALLAMAVTGLGGLPGLLAPLFLFAASLGFIGPNTTARALAPQGANAGAASAVLGTLQFVAGGLSGAFVAALPNTSAVPMAAMIAGAAMLGLAAHRGLVGRR